MRLGIDTETTGFKNPQIVQLGAVLFDVQWRVMGKIVTLIKPDGWTIEPGALAHHGITEAACARYGIPIVAALAAFKGLADSAVQAFAHNAAFDRRVIIGQLEKIGADPTWFRRKEPSFFCTMNLSTPVCRLPNRQGFSAFKDPSLEEAHRFFYPDEEFRTEHEAESDLMASARVAQALEARGLLPAPFSPMAPFQRMGT